MHNDIVEPTEPVFARRRVLQVLGGAGLLALVGCGSKSASSSASTTAGTTSAGTTAAGTTTGSASTTASSTLVDTSTAIPEETAGPYPGDGSNGANALTQSGVVRSDIRSSFGTSTTTAPGVLTKVTFKLVAVGTGKAIPNAAVYLWHADQQGRYSMYSSGVTNENFLRGVQVTDANGAVTFTTIFPGCYDGRWPHMHFEVFPSVDKITSSRNKIATSQLALPEAMCKTVYATSGYSTSVTNLAKITLKTDNVFSDGADRETPSVSGDVTNGVNLSITAPIKV
ncbi:MAG: intradiol ring-cleavage dioxygenase [Acidimicrobiia bacterium]